ncbi:MAG TPA: TerC family protein [Candidatus Limnocylindrales bacterium]|nr:TerC family protein [Candidatus Limnocylindrales bacterium]
MMIAFIQITPWHWAGFILCVLIFLALDLGLFHHQARVVKFKEALAWTAFWFALAMLFAGAMACWRGREEAVQFTAGYLIELSLSLDNVLVIALIFAWFRVPPEFQHRLLFLGILGALVMRGVMIAAGVALIHEFAWVLYLFGAFLVFAGIKMLFSRKAMVQPEKNLALRLARKLFPVTPGFVGGNFFTRLDGRFALTPLALVLLLVETTDLLFAVDSVPAVFSVTRKAFIVFTSNVFAILGLRSLYFLLAGALGYFRYLKIGLSAVLVFIGIKMLVEPHGPSPQWFQRQIPTGASLLIVAAILSLAIALSVAAARREQKAAR